MTGVGGGAAVRRASMRSLALRGSMWMAAGAVATQAVSLANNLALAWLLFPAAFGLMSIIRAVLQGLKMFSDIGIGPSIIQHARGEDPAFANTAWSIQVIRGFFLWAAMSLLAWPVAWFYQTSVLMYMLPVCGMTAAIAGFNSTALLALNRRLELKRLTLLNLGVQVLTAVATIALAWAFRSVWALVLGWFVSSLAMAVLSHAVIPQQRHRLGWDREAAKDLFGFGRWIFISTVITFFAQQVDRLMLPKLLPPSQAMHVLGVYSVALSMVLMATGLVAELAGRVLHPVLAEHARRDSSALRGKVLRSRRLILTAGVFLIAGVVVGSPILFGYIYDARYRDAAWIGQLLALPVWFMLLQISADRAALVLGDSRALALCNATRLVGSAAGSLVGFSVAGLPGFVCGMTVGTLSGHAVIARSLGRHGIPIAAQDALYTALALGAGLVGGLTPRLISGAWQVPPPLWMLLITATVVLGVVGAWAAWEARLETKR